MGLRQRNNGIWLLLVYHLYLIWGNDSFFSLGCVDQDKIVSYHTFWAKTFLPLKTWAFIWPYFLFPSPKVELLRGRGKFPFTDQNLLYFVQLAIVGISSVQSLSWVRLFATPWIAAHQASLSITNSRTSLRLTSIRSVMPSSHLILCRPLLLMPPIPPSIKVFSSESTLCMRWPKYWSFTFSVSPSKEIPGLISFRMDWLDLLAVRRTLKSLLQQHSSKASILHIS